MANGSKATGTQDLHGLIASGLLGSSPTQLGVNRAGSMQKRTTARFGSSIPLTLKLNLASVLGNIYCCTQYGKSSLAGC